MPNWERNLTPIPKSFEKKMSRIEMNVEANKVLKGLFESKGITRCEDCGSATWLTFAHKRKRRHYRTITELSDFQEVLLLCQPCHEQIEKSPTLTMMLFKKYRIDNKNT